MNSGNRFNRFKDGNTNSKNSTLNNNNQNNNLVNSNPYLNNLQSNNVCYDNNNDIQNDYHNNAFDFELSNSNKINDMRFCNICGNKGIISCQECQNMFFCSKIHLNDHLKESHFKRSKLNNSNKTNNNINKDSNNRSISKKRSKSKDTIKKPINVNEKNTVTSNNNYNNNNRLHEPIITFNNNINQASLSQEELDLRKLFENIHTLKKEIDTKFSQGQYVECILTINKSLSLAKKFYQEDHVFIIDLIFLLSESYINIGNLEEAIYNLENLLEMTETSKHQINTANYRNKTFLLIGATSINIGDYTKALKAYESAEKESLLVYMEPELNLKLAAVSLNIGICYIYLNNFSLAERVLKKGQKQIEGLLGNDIVYRLNADFNENLGLVNENNGKAKEAVSYYKKSLKTKFSFYGDSNDEVLELQYKISSAFISLKMYKEAEEIMLSVIGVLNKEKLRNSEVDCYYRYGVYFYTTGIIMLKQIKKDEAKEFFKKAEVLWKDILNQGDPALNSLFSLIKVCGKKNEE